MTIDELEEILNTMTEEEFAVFRKPWGGDFMRTRQQHVNQFRRSPKYEADLCKQLGKLTEKQKMEKVEEEAGQINRDMLVEARKGNDLSDDSNMINRSANNLDQKAMLKAEEANRLVAEANDNTRSANSVALGTLIVAIIALLLSIVSFFVSGK